MRFLFLIILLICGSVAEAKTPRRGSETVRKERAAAQKRVAQTREQIEQTKRLTRSSLRELELVQAELEAKRIDISKLQRELKALDNSISQTSDSITQLTANLETLRSSAAESARQARRMRQSMSAVTLMFSSENFNQAIKRAGYLKQLDKSRAAKAGQIRSARAALDEKKARLDSLRKKQTASLAQLEREQTELKAKETRSMELVAKLKKNEGALQKELTQRQKQAAALEAELQKAIDEEARLAAIEEEKRLAEEKRRQEEAERQRLAALEAQKAAAEAKKAEEQAAREKKAKEKKTNKKQDKKKDSTPAPQPKKTEEKVPQPEITVVENKPAANPATAADTSKSFAQSKGRLPRPYTGSGQVVQQFGVSTHSNLSKVQVENAGIDIQLQPGASASAVHEGVVSSIFAIDGYHNIVMVRHGEFLTVYGGISDLAVKKGDKVSPGQKLGRVFSDPYDDDRTILHFEVRKEREKLDPMEWLSH